MRTAIALHTPELFSAHGPSSRFIAVRHWARNFRLAAAATPIGDLEFNPYQLQFDPAVCPPAPVH